MTCPFCKAAPRSDWGYECGTGPDANKQRSVRCRDAEIAMLRERITRLESWINSLDEVLRYNGKDGQREWCGSEVGYLYQGQRVYVGGDKP